MKIYLILFSVLLLFATANAQYENFGKISLNSNGRFSSMRGDTTGNADWRSLDQNSLNSAFYYNGDLGSWWGQVGAYYEATNYNDTKRISGFNSVMHINGNLQVPYYTTNFYADNYPAFSSGTGLTAYGYVSDVGSKSTVDIDKAIGFKVETIQVQSSGNITNGFGFWCDKPWGTSTGRFGNFYTFYSGGDYGMDNSFVTGTVYHFYGYGDAPSYFGGDLQVAGSNILTTAKIGSETTYIKTDTLQNKIEINGDTVLINGIREYVALIQNSDGSAVAPTVTVLENTLGANVTWTRYSDNGIYYRITGTNLFTGTIWATSGFYSDANDVSCWIKIYKEDNSNCILFVKNISSWAHQELYTGVLTEPIKIVVYP